VDPRTSSITISTPSDLEIAIERSFNAPAALVFDAWTKPEHVRRWLGRHGDVMTVCEIDLQPGGAYRFLWSLREGGEMGLYGTYKAIARPERLESTEFFDEPYFEEMGAGTLNTMLLQERDGVTKMTLTSLYKSKEARDRVLAVDMAIGLEDGFERLDEVLRELAAAGT
jgi:uncharacterized protein YndB with AHSA1/START domain